MMHRNKTEVPENGIILMPWLIRSVLTLSLLPLNSDYRALCYNMLTNIKKIQKMQKQTHKKPT